MQKYSQRDSRWSSLILGNGDATQTIGRYGCALTCIAMIVGETPDLVNQKLKNANCFDGDLLYFARVPNAYPQLKFVEKIEYDNTKALDAIARNGFVIVEVDFDGIIATPNDTHFVNYEGNHLLLDPWDGAEKSTASYPIQKLLVIYDKVVPAPIQTSVQEVTDKTRWDFGKGYGDLELGAVRSMLLAKDAKIEELLKQVGDDASQIAQLQSKPPVTISNTVTHTVYVHESLTEFFKRIFSKSA